MVNSHPDSIVIITLQRIFPFERLRLNPQPCSLQKSKMEGFKTKFDDFLLLNVVLELSPSQKLTGFQATLVNLSGYPRPRVNRHELNLKIVIYPDFHYTINKEVNKKKQKSSTWYIITRPELPRSVPPYHFCLWNAPFLRNHTNQQLSSLIIRVCKSNCRQ